MTHDATAEAEAASFSHFFTFGQIHWAEIGGAIVPLKDHWVEVALPEGYPKSHRELFIDLFTSRYCPRPSQWAFEYDEADFNPEYFPAGRLALISDKGLAP